MRVFLALGFSVYLLLRQCTGSPSPAPSPVATAGPLPTPLVLPADAPPRILAVQMSDGVLHSGEMVSGTIVTSTNVTSVEIDLAGRVGYLPKTAPGVFSMTYRMPKVPFFLRGRYTAHIVARAAAGAIAQQDVSVWVQ